jgi:hypothetical protein
MAGRSKFHKPDQQRVRNKFLKKTGCKVYIKLKDVEEMDGGTAWSQSPNGRVTTRGTTDEMPQM